MKKIIPLLLVALFATTIVSCSKDNEDLILGTWQLESRTFINIGHPIESRNQPVTEQGLNLTLTFNKDKTGIVSFDEDTAPFTYSISGDNIIFSMEMGLDYGKNTYTESYVIDKLENNEMILSYTETDWYHEGQPDEVEYNHKTSLNFKKI